MINITFLVPILFEVLSFNIRPCIPNIGTPLKQIAVGVTLESIRRELVLHKMLAHSTLLQHIIIQAPFLKQPVQFLADIPKYWLENDGTMCLNNSHRWKAEKTIAWLRKHGLHSVPNSIKANIGNLVYNGPKKTVLDKTSNFAPPPRRFVYFTGSRASNDPPPGL